MPKWIAPGSKEFKILYLSNAPFSPSGYGVQAAGNIYDWNKYYDVRALCNYGLEGRLLMLNGVVHYPRLPGDDNADRTARLIFPVWKPNVFLTLYDIWMGAYVEPANTPDGFRPLHPFWIPYVMVDHDPIPEATAVQAAVAYKRVTPTHFGVEQFKKRGLDCEYIPFGCVAGDTQVAMYDGEVVGLDIDGRTTTSILKTHRIHTSRPVLKIVTANRQLRITADQEILTRVGHGVQWIASGSLREGDKIAVLTEDLYPSTVSIETLVDQYETLDRRRNKLSPSHPWKEVTSSPRSGIESLRLLCEPQNIPPQAILEETDSLIAMDTERGRDTADALCNNNPEGHGFPLTTSHPGGNNDKVFSTLSEEDAALCQSQSETKSTKIIGDGVGLYSGDSGWRRNYYYQETTGEQILSSSLRHEYKYGIASVSQEATWGISSQTFRHCLCFPSRELQMGRNRELYLQSCRSNAALSDSEETGRGTNLGIRREESRQIQSDEPFRRGREYSAEIKGIEYEEIVRVESTELDNPVVFDFTTSTKNFVANGIVVHNCDTKVFSPAPTKEDKLASRRRLDEKSRPFNDNNVSHMDDECFLIVANGANKDPYRKGFMRMFLATQIFLEQNPDAKKDTRWYVHSWMKQARDIPHGAKTVGLDGICRGPADYHMFQGVPDTSLCDMYRAGDVFMHLSEGGGFEIPILEAMRCGLPVMVTDFVGMPELARDHGWLIPWIRAESGAKGLYFSPLDATQAIADEYKAAEALADAYNNPDKARKFGLEGSKFAEKFDWSLVNPMWYKFFEEIRAEIRHAPLEERVIQ